MINPDPIRELRIAIHGLGLIGGSLALALRNRCATLLGVDIDPMVVKKALALGLVDQASVDPRDILPQADLLVLAAPVQEIISSLEQLPYWHPGRTIVLDVGSTKMEIVGAMQALPERFDPIGGHPMCGKERGTLENAEAGLFQEAVFALTYLERTSPRACLLAEGLVQAIGAQPLWLAADVHDRWVAATSHLPYLLANTLAAVTPAETQAMIGPGLRSTARLAAHPLGIMQDILMTNRSNILDALHLFQIQLADLTDSLETSDWSRLAATLERGRNHYEQFITHS